MLNLRYIFIFLFLGFCSSAFGQTKKLSDSCYHLNRINIEGKTRTQDQYIWRELPLQVGDCITDLVELEKISIDRLLNLKLFNEVSVTWDFKDDQGVEMNIYVLDRFPIYPEGNLEFADRNFNVWVKEQRMDLRRINLGLTLTDHNFRGKRELLSVSGQVGYTQKAGISYSRPFADKNQKHGFGFSAYALQNKEIAYQTQENKLVFHRDEHDFMYRQYDFSAWYTYRPDYALTHIFQLGYQYHEIDEQILELHSNFLGDEQRTLNTISLKYRLEYNGVDNWNYPLTGKRAILEIQEVFSSKKNLQSSIHVQYDQYWQKGKNYFFSFIFRSKFSLPQSTAYIFRQNLGYDHNYVRGYEYYVIDGSSFVLGRLNAKRKLLDYSLRLPIRYFEIVPIRIYGKVFADAGIGYQKYPMKDDQLQNKALYAYGFGVDIISLYDIKLRIEYAFNGLGEKGLFLHRNGE